MRILYVWILGHSEVHSHSDNDRLGWLRIRSYHSIYKNVFAITPRKKTAVAQLDITFVQAARFVRFTGAVWTSGKKDVVGIDGGYHVNQGDDIYIA